MKWKTSRPHDTRERSGFLLLPKRVGYEARWWEFAYWGEYYDGNNWHPLRWLDSSNVKDS